MIGRNGERRSGISALAARHDDDDDLLLAPKPIPCARIVSKKGILRIFIRLWGS